jgi:hypothetical protein
MHVFVSDDSYCLWHEVTNLMGIVRMLFDFISLQDMIIGG